MHSLVIEKFFWAEGSGHTRKEGEDDSVRGSLGRINT